MALAPGSSGFEFVEAAAVRGAAQFYSPWLICALCRDDEHQEWRSWLGAAREASGGGEVLRPGFIEPM